jgi:hypothetical protein
MMIYPAPEFRKRAMAEAFREGHITLTELMDELEWYWDRKNYRGTRVPPVERTSSPTAPAIEKQDR